jgi:hypothetical protein
MFKKLLNLLISLSVVYSLVIFNYKILDLSKESNAMIIGLSLILFYLLGKEK